MRKLVIGSIIIVLLLLVLGLVTYFTQFHGEMSTSSSDWSAFSNYMSLFVGIASLCIVALVSFLTFKINEESTRAAISAASAAKLSADVAIKNLAATERYYQQQMEPVIDFS